MNEQQLEQLMHNIVIKHLRLLVEANKEKLKIEIAKEFKDKCKEQPRHDNKGHIGDETQF